MQPAVVAVLVLLSGFFSGTETAVYRAHWVRLTNWAERRTPGAGTALRLLEWREATVIAALVGNNLVNVFASVLAAEFTARSFGPGYTSIAVVLLVALTLVFGEFLPKTVAQANPNRWLRHASGPLAGAMVLFAPAVVVLAGISRLTAGAAAKQRGGAGLTRQDLLSALRERERQAGAVPAGTAVSSLAARLFRFSRLVVAEAAIPLARVRSLPERATRAELLALVAEHGYSRIPVYRDRPEQIAGLVFAKDLLAPGAPRVRPVRRIAAGTRMMAALDELQRRGEHMVLVEDAGRVTGIVTLEDILEELVGEIRSED
ncbi:MAG: CNNM domain-containing protein [bacterium]